MTKSKASKVKAKSESPSDTSMDEFVVVTPDAELPLRSKLQDDDVGLEIHPLSEDSGVLISVRPPRAPQVDIYHVPVDIVLVIDVSGSMHFAAPLPDTQDREEKESAGLSVLDLTKHAARTILAPLNANDRLALVTFSADARIVQELTHMTKKAKQDMWAKIESLQTDAATNLWGGIKTGLQVFEQATTINNMQGMFVLTDGMPNHMCPPQGYVNKLKPMLAKMTAAPSIHTFGFGYDMRSDLMQSIAEIGNGNYSFIPDAGMIGTIFVHAMANLCSTFSAAAELEIRTSDSTELQCPTVFNIDRPNSTTMILSLGNIQYGQTRDMVITSKKNKRPIIVRASLKYKNNLLDESEDAPEWKLASTTLNKVSARIPQCVIDYHGFRSQLCASLAALFPIQQNNEHTALNGNSFDFEHARGQLDSVVLMIKSSANAEDPNIKSLLTDLVGDEPCGQISKAVTTTGANANFYNRWGRHYLPSLLHAHARQVCNSFKDPGPLRYGLDSPLFIKCRDEMDATFENMPAPKPTRPQARRYDGTYVPHSKVSMARYHSSANPCFEGQCEVMMGDESTLSVSKLRQTMEVWTPKGPRRVVAIVKTTLQPINAEYLCRVGDLWVTPWHPINHQGAWVFPAAVCDETKSCESSVYSVLLTFSTDPEAHAIQVGGQLCTTLGHGLRAVDTNNPDARAHAFFGSYVKVIRSLMRLPKNDDGHLISVGVERDSETGLVCGFKVPAGHVESLVKAVRTKRGVRARRSPVHALSSKKLAVAA